MLSYPGLPQINFDCEISQQKSNIEIGTSCIAGFTAFVCLDLFINWQIY
jgi:hypothetical protein